MPDQVEKMPSPRKWREGVLRIVKYEVRYRGLFHSAWLGCLASAGSSVSQVMQIYAKAQITPGDVAVALALSLWTVCEAILLVPIAGVKTHEGQTLSAAETEKNNRKIKFRNGLLRIAILADVSASLSYIAAGLFLGNPAFYVAGSLYTAASCVRFFRMQGEVVTKPVRPEGMGRLQYAKEFSLYAARLLKSNPNALAEALMMPGLVASFIGLASILPPLQAAVIISAHVAASVCRTFSVALQRTQVQQDHAVERR